MSDSNKDMQTMVLIGQEITIAGEVFVIKPFVIRNRTKVLKIVSDVFAKIATKSQLKDTPNSEVISELVSIAGDKLVELYEMVLIGKDVEWIQNNVTIPDEISLIQIIWEINQFPLLQSQFQKIIEQFTTK